MTPWPPGIPAVIPVFNHAAQVGDVVRSLRVLGAEVLVADDGSTDGSGTNAAAAGAKLVNLGRNQGKASALQAGLAVARTHGAIAAVTVDADGQHHAEDALRLALAAQGEPTAIHLGVRTMPDAPWFSRVGRRLSNAGVRLCTGRRIADTQTGLRAYPLPTALSLPVRSQRFAWEVEILVHAHRSGIAIRELPVGVRYPRDRISHFAAVRDSLRLSGTLTRLLFRA